MSYPEFFRNICGHDPFPYQRRFHETAADLKLLRVPTGLGKTDAVLTDWLQRRPTTRLVYCLPGRALTTQIAGIARRRVQRAGLENQIQILELMGGKENLELTLRPNQAAILVGTQDILISRALNRGYARSPFRWPIDFALLNNDAAWVFDEVQLLGDALATSAQLAAFRKRFFTFGNVPCVWMSATFDQSSLQTVDFQEKPAVITLSEEDLAIPEVNKRVHAAKILEPTTQCSLPKDCARFVAEQHRQGTLTLVITNTVARAQEVWDELKKTSVTNPALLHSRFRPYDREGIVDKILASKDGIIVSTQVIEAGVDIDAHLMITDVAPWPSLVQRFGRVNRRGDRPEARIYWVPSPQRQKSKLKTDGSEFAPYDPEQVRQALATLESLHSAAPADLNDKLDQPAPYRFVLRKSDLLDLFDTTPDLAGNHVDVSRFVRSGEETNVYVAWREWPEKEDPPKQKILQEELCPVPHFPGGNSELTALLKKHPAWTWNVADKGRWEKLSDSKRLYAGMRILLRSQAGGYDSLRGWAPESKSHVKPVPVIPLEPEDAGSSDPTSESAAQTLAQHTEEVVAELEALLSGIPIELNGTRKSLETAARYHDWGKAHPVFQQTLHNMPETPSVAPESLLAKQQRALSRARGHSRRWFRHELASALAMLPYGDWLAAYIVASHHGKVRVNIRSMPGETDTRADQKKRIARGIRAEDRLFAADLGSAVNVAETSLDLSPMALGIENGIRGWSDQVLDLLTEHGPFRLAYLEMLLRAADESASAKAKGAELQ